MKLLIIGHGQHGKDTVGEMIQAALGLKYESSSEFVGIRHVWPKWGQYRYVSFQQCFNDRDQHRTQWGDLIEEYNTPDAARTAREMIEEGNDMYIGLRRRAEFEAAKGFYDHIVWVDASKRKPPEPVASMHLCEADATCTIDNNTTEADLATRVLIFCERIKA